jgi:DNA-binding beta-propeller fold protein YncE
VVVDTENNTISAKVALGGALGFVGQEGSAPMVAFSERGDKAFVVTSGGGVNSSLFVIDTELNEVVSSTSFGSTFLLAVAVSPSGEIVYIASSNGILVLDAKTKAIITTIAPGHDITGLALSRDGDRLYGSDNSGLVGGTSGVLVIDTDKNRVVTTVPLPFGPSLITGLALARDGRHVYAEDFFFTAAPVKSTVTVIDTADNSIDTSITADGLSLIALAASPKSGKLLAVNGVLSSTVDSTVAVINPRDNAIEDSISVGVFADAVATQPPGNRHDNDDDDDNAHGREDQ